MNKAAKFLKKWAMSPLEAWEAVPNEDEENEANRKSLIRISVAFEALILHEKEVRIAALKDGALGLVSKKDLKAMHDV